MKKHLYLYSSNIQYARYLCEDEKFHYCIENTKSTDENSNMILTSEYGFIETRQNFYHIILGGRGYRKENCPWCGTLTIFKFSKLQYYIQCYMQCENCGSRGPVNNVQLDVCSFSLEDPIFKEIADLTKNEFTIQRPWDVDFVNPYE